jgi:putative Mn2+ efflux pump MntP
LSTTIGVITAILTAVGMIFGSRIGSRWGTRAEIVGGIVLILIGVRILAADLHLFP